MMMICLLGIGTIVLGFRVTDAPGQLFLLLLVFSTCDRKRGRRV